MNAYTLFISDVHLKATQPARLDCLRELLQTQANKADALYILGDFFDFWAGDDDLTVFNQEVIQLLAEFTQSNTPLYYMLGNHDFMIGKKFFNKTGAKPLTDPTVINLYGQRILLCHGDSLCTRDSQHLRYRKLMHNKPLQKLACCFPLHIRKNIASHFHNKSHLYYQTNHDTKLTPPQPTVEHAMREAQVNLLIHGHTHRPKIHTFTLDGQSAARCVLGDWGHQAQILKYNDNNTYELIALSPAN